MLRVAVIVGGLQIQLNPRLKDNELIGVCFAIGEVAQQAAIRIGTFTKPRNLKGLRRLPPGEQGGSQHHSRQGSNAGKDDSEQQPSSTTSLALTLRPCPTGDRNILPLGASRRGGPNQGADA